MTKVISALTARTQLGQIMDRIEKNKERFIIDRRGEPRAIIMSIKDYIDLIAPAPDWLKEAWENSKRNGLDKLTMREIDAEIRSYRREESRKELKHKR